MKKTFIFFLLLSVLIGYSCSKEEPAPTPSGSLKFNSLIAADTLIKVNAITTITASAEGDGLAYQWSATYGTFIGNGPQVQWTVCHKDKFIITCKVTDKNNNSESRQIAISTYN